MSEQTETTPKTIAVFATEYYETSIVREPIELNIEDYPELDGMTPEEVIEYVESNAWDMKPTNEEYGYDSLAEELNSQDIRRDKITNESQDINAQLEMF
jgi:hypothetical protein